MTVVIRPVNGSSVSAGDKVRCSVEENVSSADNCNYNYTYTYRWIDSATGKVIHQESAEWTIRPCSQHHTVHDDADMMEICVNTTDDGLMMLECHVTVGMTTAHGVVTLYLEEPKTTCTTAATGKS